MSERQIELAGRTFTLAKPVSYWQAVTDHIRNSRVDPIAVAIAMSARTPRDAVAGLFAGAFDAARRRNVVTFQDIEEFSRTPEGLAFHFQMAAAVHHGAEFNHFDAATRFVYSLTVTDETMLKSTLDELGR